MMRHTKSQSTRFFFNEKKTRKHNEKAGNAIIPNTSYVNNNNQTFTAHSVGANKELLAEDLDGRSTIPGCKQN